MFDRTVPRTLKQSDLESAFPGRDRAMQQLIERQVVRAEE
jgi:hypothetical protein